MKLKLILFDIDGTLVNSYPRYVKIMEQLLPLYDITPTDEIFISTFPKTADQTLRKLNIPLNQKETFLRRYLNIDQQVQTKEILYPGIESALKNLITNPKLKLGIVTSRDNNEVQSLLRQFPIFHSMNVLVSADSVSEHKPSPMPINFAMKQLGIETKDTIYIGDAKTDLQAAEAANVQFAAAMWGTNEGHAFTSDVIRLNRTSKILQLIKN